jgi:hypothetical protein
MLACLLVCLCLQSVYGLCVRKKYCDTNSSSDQNGWNNSCKLKWQCGSIMRNLPRDTAVQCSMRDAGKVARWAGYCWRKACTVRGSGWRQERSENRVRRLAYKGQSKSCAGLFRPYRRIGCSAAVLVESYPTALSLQPPNESPCAAVPAAPACCTRAQPSGRLRVCPGWQHPGCRHIRPVHSAAVCWRPRGWQHLASARAACALHCYFGDWLKPMEVQLHPHCGQRRR